MSVVWRWLDASLKPARDESAPEPRCLCTHRWAEHYGTRSNLYPARGCQRPGCECRAFVEPEHR